MKRLITLAAATTVVLAMTAAVAAASASASIETILCGKNDVFCPAASVKPAGTQLVTAVYSGYEGSTNLQVVAGSNYVTCTEAVMTAKTTAEAGNPLLATGENSLVGENCRANFGWLNPQCSSASMNNPPEAIAAIKGGGVIRMGTAEQPLTLSFNCAAEAYPGPFRCTYRGVEVPLEIHVVEQGKITASIHEAPLTLVNGEGCSSSAKLNSTGFEYYTSQPVYIAYTEL
jgi:hypothetical protein